MSAAGRGVDAVSTGQPPEHSPPPASATSGMGCGRFASPPDHASLAANTAKRRPPASDRRPPVRAHGPDILVCVASTYRNAGSREETVPRMCKLGRIAFVAVIVGCFAARAQGGQQPAPSPPDVAALQTTIDQLRQQLD